MFFKHANGSEPVREFLRRLSPAERKLVGRDVRTAKYGWPIGMPTCQSLGDGFQEARTNLPNRICRVLFKVDKAGRMILLHGLIKKTQATPKKELDLAQKRWSQHEEAGT